MAAAYFQKMGEAADKVTQTGQDTGLRTMVLGGAKVEEVSVPLIVSSEEGRRFATEHAALVCRFDGNDCMVQQNLVRHLLAGHLLPDKPDLAGNKWRISCRPPPPTSLWRTLPCFSSGTVPLGVEQKAVPAHNNMVSCTFWLLATGFDLGHRNVFDTLVRSPDRLSICPYLGIQYSEKESEMDQALEHLVMTGSHALYDRLLLRKAAAEAKYRPQGCGPTAVGADEAISYYVITLSHTSYKIYRLTAHHKASMVPYYQSPQEHQSLSVSESLGDSTQTSTYKSGSRLVEPSDGGISSSSSRGVPVGCGGRRLAPTAQSKGRVRETRSRLDVPPRRSDAPTSTGTSAGDSHRIIDNNDPWTGCEVAQISFGGCREVESLLALVDWVN